MLRGRTRQQDGYPFIAGTPGTGSQPGDPLSSLPSLSRRAMLGGSAAMVLATAAGCSAARKSAQQSTTAAPSGILNVGISQDVVPPNMLRITSPNTPVQSLVFDTLLGANLSTLAPQPGIATSWDWDSSKTKLTVKLRDDVTFHSGRPFGPEDVIFTMGQLAAPGSGAQVATLVTACRSIRATGKDEVTFELKSPLSNFLDLLMIAPMVDSKTFSGLASGKQVVGTGPFTWKSWSPGASLKMEKNASYWGGAPQLDGVTLQVYQQSQTRLSALESGEIGLAWEMPSQDASLLAKRGGYTVITSTPQYSNWYVGINVRTAPFNDKRVRQAIAYCLDRERIAAQVFAGYGQASSIPWPTTVPGVTSADDRHYSYDAEKAKSLLRAAGAGHLSVSLVYQAGNAVMTSVYNIVQYNLQQIGLTVNGQGLQATTYQSQIQAGSFKDLWVGNMDASGLAIATQLSSLNPFKVGKNTSNLTDPQYAKLAGALSAATSSSAQADATQALTAYMLDQAFNLTVAHGHYTSPAKAAQGITHSLVDNLVLSRASA